jgi:hypothetical protein
MRYHGMVLGKNGEYDWRRPGGKIIEYTKGKRSEDEG